MNVFKCVFLRNALRGVRLCSVCGSLKKGNLAECDRCHFVLGFPAC